MHPGPVPLNIWLDNLKKLGSKLDFSASLIDFAVDIQEATALEGQAITARYEEIENEYKYEICNKIIEEQLGHVDSDV